MRALTIVLLFATITAFAKGFDKGTFESTVKTIQEKTYYELSDNEIYQAALSGILRHLESKNRELKGKKPFQEDANILLPPRNVSEMKKEMKGEISGIGVGIKYDKEQGQVYPILIDVIKGGGAEKSGLKKGDQILKIDGKPVNKFNSFKDIVYRIRGKSGTKVKLAILRDGESFTKKVRREKIKWDAVEVSEKNKEYSLIKINFFNEKTVSTLEKKISSMKRRGARKLILDLRGNTGGLFEEGLKAIKLFAKKNQTVLKAKYPNSEVRKFESKSDGIGHGLKVITLISKDTKSMGEAFAASLKNLVKATIVGEKSFGKGTVETVVELKNKYSVKFTVGRLFTSDDKTWDKEGVTPDIVIPSMEKTGQIDSQLELAKTLISKR